MSTVSSTSSTTSTTSTASNSLSEMTGEDFLQLLVTELSNQDPFEPMSNKEILEQLSAIRSLQSNLELSENFETLIDTQQLLSGTSLVGKTVLGVDTSGELIQGVVQAVVLDSTGTYLQIGDREMALDNLIALTETAEDDSTDTTDTTDSTDSTDSTDEESDDDE